MLLQFGYDLLRECPQHTYDQFHKNPSVGDVRVDQAPLSIRRMSLRGARHLIFDSAYYLSDFDSELRMFS